MPKLDAIKSKIEALDDTDYRGAEFTVQGREIKSILGGIVSYLEQSTPVVPQKLPVAPQAPAKTNG